MRQKNGLIKSYFMFVIVNGIVLIIKNFEYEKFFDKICNFFQFLKTVVFHSVFFFALVTSSRV